VVTFLALEPYLEQVSRWPRVGRHILASFDEQTIVVYQAYKPSIAAYAVANQRFGGEFCYSRMSWIKPNFLWMMYRSGWATKPGQERVLAVRLDRTFFDRLLAQAVPSSHDPARYPSRETWANAVASSEVRLQWDPDHDPLGRPVERRAVQLGLRGEALREFGNKAVSIDDVTPTIEAQRVNATGDFNSLLVPAERVYLPDTAHGSADADQGR
jgi:hypothetical protein